MTLSSGKLTLTGTTDPDVVTIDWQAQDDPAGKPSRFEITAGSGTTLTGACTFASSTNRECLTSAVSSFEFIGSDGNDALYLVDEDPSRGTDALTANLGAGDDRFDTSSPYLGRLPMTTWSDAVTVNGEDGGDYIEGSTSGDTINGGAGNDTVSASTGADTINGSSDNDTLRGGSDNDAISGSSGDDALFGDSGDDTLTPGTGADTVDGGLGGDVASYGDRFALFVPATPVNVSLDGVANDGAAREGDNVGPGIEHLTGGSADDVLTGDDGSNTIVGGSGNDELHGRGGGDVLDGQADSDLVRGGAGPDDLRDTGTSGADTVDYGDAPAGVRVDLAGGPGMGVADDPDALAPAFEHATGGPGNDDLNGNAAANRLAGGAGNDIIDGLGGDDTLQGGAGNDTLNGGDGGDRVLGEAGNDSLEGAAGPDTVDGGDDADVVFGGPGGTADADVLNGGQGRDAVSYEGRTTGVSVTTDGVANDGGAGEKDNVGSDFEGLIGGAGPDVLTLTAPVRFALLHVPILRPAPVITIFRPTSGRISAALVTIESGRFVQGGAGNDQITGGIGNDALSGGAGRDKVLGGAGSDAVFGGSGDDTVDGQDGNDRVIGNEGNDNLGGGKGADFMLAADKFGRDKVDCGDEPDFVLRDVRDQTRKTNPCERAVGVDKASQVDDAGKDLETFDESLDQFSEDGDSFEDTDNDGEIIPSDFPETEGFGDLEFDDFGAGFEDDFLGGLDEFSGFEDEFGDAGGLGGAVMKLPTKTVKVKRQSFAVKLECPKAATRRCVGEIAVIYAPKKGKPKELGSELFRTNRGKKATLSFKLRSKLRKLVPKGKKGITAQVVVEARDGGDLLFGLTQDIVIRR